MLSWETWAIEASDKWVNGVGVVKAGTYLCQILICISGKVIEIMLIDNYIMLRSCVH